MLIYNVTFQTLCSRIFRKLLAMLCLLSAQAAVAQNTPAPEEAASPNIIVPVLYAYSTLSNPQTTVTSCWEILMPERQILIRQENARPWLLKNWVPLIGAAMGGVTAGLLLKRHVAAIVAKKWAVPVILGGAAGGFALGPGGVTGAVIGGAIGEKLGKRKLPITIAGMAGGAAAGKAIWDKLFPPSVPPASGGGPDDDIAVEVFLRDQICASQPQVSYTHSIYRVGYLFNDEELVTELPYDPGEALFMSAEGNITGPARVRLD